MAQRSTSEDHMKSTSHLTVAETGTVAMLVCALLSGPADASAFVLFRAGAAGQVSPATDVAPGIPAEQLDALVAPLALYPDPLLAQTLAASTYPLELMQLQQWLERNS